MSSCLEVDDARRSLRAGYRIDSCAVDQLLEEVFRECWDHLALRGLDLRPEVIAWDPLNAAADCRALASLLVTAITHVASNTEEGIVHARAFPSLDDLYVVFEIQNECPARRTTDRVAAFTNMMERARLQIESMGGVLAEYSTEDGGSRVCFKLPQWV